MTRSSLQSQFKKSAAPVVAKKLSQKNPPPFSIRFTHAERAQLKRDAGRMALSSYIRLKLFEDADGIADIKSKARKHVPTMDHALLAQLLGTIGQSELGRSMLALSLATQSGALPVDDETVDKIDTACSDVAQMRHMLIVALGIKDQI